MAMLLPAKHADAAAPRRRSEQGGAPVRTRRAAARCLPQERPGRPPKSAEATRPLPGAQECHGRQEPQRPQAHWRTARPSGALWQRPDPPGVMPRRAASRHLSTLALPSAERHRPPRSRPQRPPGASTNAPAVRISVGSFSPRQRPGRPRAAAGQGGSRPSCRITRRHDGPECRGSPPSRAGTIRPGRL